MDAKTYSVDAVFTECDESGQKERRMEEENEEVMVNEA